MEKGNGKESANPLGEGKLTPGVENNVIVLVVEDILGVAQPLDVACLCPLNPAPGHPVSGRELYAVQPNGSVSV